MVINTGGPAFPTEMITPPASQATFELSTGLTIRDYFAATIIQSLLRTTWSADTRTVAEVIDTWATDSYRIADAMIKARG